MISKFDGAYGFLSNFFPCCITYKGRVYPSVEHAFQAAKTKNPKQREEIRRAPTPGQAKKLGRKADLREDWDDIRIQIMHDLLRLKFKKANLRAHLLATGNEQLVEGNWWGDTFWGVFEPTMQGENHLGKLLMKVREEIRAAYHARSRNAV